MYYINNPGTWIGLFFEITQKETGRRINRQPADEYLIILLWIYRIVTVRQNKLHTDIPRVLLSVRLPESPGISTFY